MLKKQDTNTFKFDDRTRNSHSAKLIIHPGKHHSAIEFDKKSFFKTQQKFKSSFRDQPPIQATRLSSRGATPRNEFGMEGFVAKPYQQQEIQNIHHDIEMIDQNKQNMIAIANKQVRLSSDDTYENFYQSDGFTNQANKAQMQK